MRIRTAAPPSTRASLMMRQPIFVNLSFPPGSHHEESLAHKNDPLCITATRRSTSMGMSITGCRECPNGCLSAAGSGGGQGFSGEGVADGIECDEAEGRQSAVVAVEFGAGRVPGCGSAHRAGVVNTLARLASVPRVMAGYSRVRPGTGERIAPLLGIPAPYSFEALVTALVNELASQTGEDEALLVLDDYHLI